MSHRSLEKKLSLDFIFVFWQMWAHLIIDTWQISSPDLATHTLPYPYLYCSHTDVNWANQFVDLPWNQASSFFTIYTYNQRKLTKTKTVYIFIALKVLYLIMSILAKKAKIDPHPDSNSNFGISSRSNFYTIFIKNLVLFPAWSAFQHSQSGPHFVF